MSIFEINLNGHYVYFDDEEALKAYALAGLNLSNSSIETIFGGTSNTEVGLNLGTGGEYFFTDMIGGMLELRYVIGDADQFVINLGLLVNLGN